MIPLPDQGERDAIRQDLDANLFVEASAGTGKTHELVSRMISLVARGGVPVRQIAAVTFTRKATAELRERFQIELEQAASLESSPDRKGRLVAALDELDSCFIGTIHSFCAELLRERPVEAGLAPGFREVPDDDPELLELRDRVWREQLETLETEQGEDRLRELLEVGIEPDDLRDCYETLSQFPEIEFPLETGTEAGAPAAVREAASRIREFLDEALQALDGQRNVKTVFEPLKESRAAFEAASLESPPSAAEALALFEGKIKDPKEDPRKMTLGQQWAERARTIRDEVGRPALERWRRFVYPRVMAFVTRAEREFRLRRRKSGMIGFTDLLIHARDVLREHRAVREDLGRRFSRILVDEFQDTDPVQAEVLLYLTGDDLDEKDWRKLQPRAGSLFVVGDPKQAIYRFRRADLAAYDTFKEIFLATGRELRLSASFRSLPEICGFVNRAFENVFAGKGDEAQAGAARLEATRSGGGGSEAVLRSAVSTTGGERARAAALRHAEDTAGFVASERGKRELSDFLFLATKRARLGIYQQALERRGIPAMILSGTEKSRPEEVPAGLLGFAAALEAAAAPTDEVPLVAFLRSGLCGASDEALLRFRDLGGRFDAFSTPPPDADPRIAGGLSLVRDCIGDAEGLPPAAAVARMAERCGLLASAAAEEARDSAVATAARVLALARRLSAEGLPFRDVTGELVSLIREARVSATSLSSEDDAVRLMTIHSAKGLEASVVLLADPGDEDEPDQPECHIERTDAPLGYVEVARVRGQRPRQQRTVLARPPGWAEMAERETRASEAEIPRRRYVASTRARDLLVVGINRHTTNDEPDLRARGQWKTFEPFLRADLEVRAAASVQAECGDIDLLTMYSEARDRADLRRQTLRGATYRLEAVTRKEEAAAEPASRQVIEGGRGPAFGRVMHRMLEAMMRRDDLEPRSLAEFLLDAEELPAMEVEEVVRLTEAVRASGLWHRAQGADERLVEVPFVVPLEGDDLPGILRGAVDLAFREGDRWWIVDYKSDRLSPGRLEALIARYRPQVECYRREWELFSGKPTRAGLCFLERPEEPVWLEP